MEIMSDEWLKDVNIKLHTGHVRHLDLCENCIPTLGRESVRDLLLESVKKFALQEESV